MNSTWVRVLNGQLLVAGDSPQRPPGAGGGKGGERRRGGGSVQIAGCFLLRERRGIPNRFSSSLGLLQTANLAQGAL